MSVTKKRFFKTPTDFREWLEKNHDKVSELYVAFYKKSSGKPSITYHEALDQALCFGWIDGVRNSIDEVSYSIRFTPRKARSIWSVVNTKRAEELKTQGQLRPAGLKAFELRDPERSGIYSFENRPKQFDKQSEKNFRANKTAWDFFQQLPTYYRNTVIYWVMSAKKEETRLRRLARLIECSSRRLRIDELSGSAKRKTK